MAMLLFHRKTHSATLDGLGYIQIAASCKHFYSVIVQFEPIRTHIWQIYCYMEAQMKETLEVMKVGNMSYEDVGLPD